MSLETIRQRIHRRSESFSQLKTAINDLNLDESDPYDYSFLQDHLLRELNKRAYLEGQTSEMITPYGAGFRPTTISLPLPVSGGGGGDSMVLIGGDNMEMINGDDLVPI